MTNHVHLLLAPGDSIAGLGQLMKALAARATRYRSRREKAARLSAALGDLDGAKYEKAQFCACACDAVGE
jgi:hypothetical protein